QQSGQFRPGQRFVVRRHSLGRLATFGLAGFNRRHRQYTNLGGVQSGRRSFGGGQLRRQRQRQRGGVRGRKFTSPSGGAARLAVRDRCRRIPVLRRVPFQFETAVHRRGRLAERQHGIGVQYHASDNRLGRRSAGVV